MNHDPRSSGGAGPVVAILLLLALLLIGAIGLGAGFFFVSTTVVTPPPATVSMKSPTPVPATADSIAVVGRFALSERDIKDHQEAPALAITPDGHVLLAYASQTGDEERTLLVARSADGEGFSDAQPLRKAGIFYSVGQSHGKEVKRPRRLLPQLAVGGGSVFLGWIEPNADNTTVIYYVAESHDNGATFGDPVRVHESDGARPNFLSLAADSAGNVVAAWLDQRAGIPQPFAALKPAGQSAFLPETQAYSSPNEAGVCPCCPTATALGPDEQAYVAFRNQLDGYRDIFVGHRPLAGGSAFTDPVRIVNEPRWTFDGCPHDGPSLAIDTQNLYVAWMDASSGTPRCYYTQKPLGGGSFSPPQLLNPASTGPEANAEIAGSDGGLVAVWEAALGADSAQPAADAHDVDTTGGNSAGSSRAIYRAVARRIYTPQGDAMLTWQPAQPIAARPDAFQTRPTLAVGRDGSIFAAWNELDTAGKRVVVARLERGGP